MQCVRQHAATLVSRTTDTENPNTPAGAESAMGAARDPAEQRRHLVKNTAFYSLATGLSRIAGLVREIVAASKFGVTGPIVR